MSYHWVDAVLSQSPARGLDRLVLVVLAERANVAGECWPSLADLAARAALHRRNVQHALQRLEALGCVAVRRSRGRGHTSRYQLQFAAPAQHKEKVAPSPPFAAKEKVAPTTEKVALDARKGGATATPTIRNHQEPPDARARALQPEGRARAEPDPDPTPPLEPRRPLDLFHEALARLAARTGRAPPAPAVERDSSDCTTSRKA